MYILIIMYSCHKFLRHTWTWTIYLKNLFILSHSNKPCAFYSVSVNNLFVFLSLWISLCWSQLHYLCLLYVVSLVSMLFFSLSQIRVFEFVSHYYLFPVLFWRSLVPCILYSVLLPLSCVISLHCSHPIYLLCIYCLSVPLIFVTSCLVLCISWLGLSCNAFVLLFFKHNNINDYNINDLERWGRGC